MFRNFKWKWLSIGMVWTLALISIKATAQDKIVSRPSEIIALLYAKSNKINSYIAGYIEIARDPRSRNFFGREGKYFYKKGRGLKIISYFPGRENSISRIQLVKGEKIINFDLIANSITQIDLAKLKGDIGEKYALFFDPLENSDLRKPLNFFSLIGAEFRGWEVKKIAGKYFYIFTLEEIPLPPSEAPPEENLPPLNTRVFIESANGLLSKIEKYDDQGVIFYSLEIKNIEINPALPDKIFDLSIPQGVKPLDITKEVQEDLEQQKEMFDSQTLLFTYPR